MPHRLPRTTRVARAAALLCAVSSPLSALAAMPADDTPVQSVVVTAQRRTQALNDVGAAVTVLNGADLDRLAIDTPKDIAALTPGLSAVNATSGGTPIFAIRGIGLDDFSSNNTSGVAIYVDDVLAAYPVLLNGPLFDVQRVEVLKGPQGTLYGKNSTGGAINFISRRPTAQPSAYFSASAGQWRALSLDGAVSGPLKDGVNGRLAFTAAKDHGWQHDAATGRRALQPG
jgi:iron complex outermembrane recepter protein